MAAPKRARARKSGKVARKSAARWYDSNWFLLLLVTFEQSVVAEDGRPLDLRIDLTERVR